MAKSVLVRFATSARALCTCTLPAQLRRSMHSGRQSVVSNAKRIRPSHGQRSRPHPKPQKSGAVVRFNSSRQLDVEDIVTTHEQGLDLLQSNFDLEWMHAQIQAQLPNQTVPLLEFRHGQLAALIRDARESQSCPQRSKMKQIFSNTSSASWPEWAAPPCAVGAPIKQPLDVIVVDPTTSSGLAVGPNNWLFLVPTVMPGEKVTVMPLKHFFGFSKARVVRIDQPNDNRAKPPCKYYKECSGCTLQHLQYSQQLESKHDHLVSKLSKFGSALRFLGQDHTKMSLSQTVASVVPSPKQLHYRNVFVPKYDINMRNPNSTQVGSMRRFARSEVVDIPSCILLTSELDTEYNRFRKMARKFSDLRKRVMHGTTTIRRTLVPPDGMSIETAQQKLSQSNQFVESVPPGWRQHATSSYDGVSTEIVNGMVFQFFNASFFNANTVALPLILDHIREALHQHLPSDPGSNNRRLLIDAYSGVGLYGLSFADMFERVVGFESDPNAVHFAIENTRINGITNATYARGLSEQMVFETLSDAQTNGIDPMQTAVILSPNRNGVHNIVLDTLLHKGPKIIVYIALDADSLATDLAHLLGDPYAKLGWKYQSIPSIQGKSLRPIVEKLFEGELMPKHTPLSPLNNMGYVVANSRRGFAYAYGCDYGGHDYDRFMKSERIQSVTTSQGKQKSRYSIASITPFDTSPQTSRYTSVVVLVRE